MNESPRGGLERVVNRARSVELEYRVAEVVWAARVEMARTVEDVLSRRTRALVLDARAAMAAAPKVAEVLAKELGRDARWQAEQVQGFIALADSYVVQ